LISKIDNHHTVVIDFNDLIEAGSELEAKNRGKIRTEGKEYIMSPNDVVEFRFNV